MSRRDDAGLYLPRQAVIVGRDGFGLADLETCKVAVAALAGIRAPVSPEETT